MTGEWSSKIKHFLFFHNEVCIFEENKRDNNILKTLYFSTVINLHTKMIAQNNIWLKFWSNYYDSFVVI